MSLKQYLDSHPLTLIIGISAAVATSTAGTVQFFSEKVHKAELTQISTKHTAAISVLQTRLVSIERKIGDGEAFFDVSRLILPPNSIKSLGKDFKTIDGGRFFIAEPDMTGWTYNLTSEIALLKDIVTFKNEMAAMVDLLAPVLGKKNIHLWRSNDSIKFSPKDDTGRVMKEVEFNFFPYVALQVLPVSELPGLVADIQDAVETELRAEEILSRVSDLLDILDIENKEVDNKGDAKAGGSKKASEKGILKDSELASGEARLEIESDLSELFRGDLASIMLAAISNQIISMPVYFPGSTSALQTVQKKGNVLYIQSLLKFSEVQLADNKQDLSVSLHQEFFIATNSEYIFFIKVHIPSTDGRSKAFPWVSQWLSGIRIPFNGI